ncbi:hypothetical protein CBOM_02621 [Ceraceosorus bombacis]|uniref:Uncharacterized protein n=1 Tax=Ceraceosorus bombacis TaxID=401625 RepID=A0A0P1BF62_9BASI|nr:hypothetical protein CBOM_02621 [Ceraceosorus bombacis]
MAADSATGEGSTPRAAASRKLPENHRELNRAACGLLSRAMDPKYLDILDGHESDVHEMWKAISAYFTPPTSDGKVRTAQHWFRFTQTDSDINVHIRDYKNLVASMRDLTITQDNWWLVIRFLDSLNTDYDRIREKLLEKQPIPTLEEVFTRIHDEWLSARDRHTALAASAPSRHPSRTPSPALRDGPPPAPCRKCGGNHWNAQCAATQATLDAFKNKSKKKPSAHLASAPHQPMGLAGQPAPVEDLGETSVGDSSQGTDVLLGWAATHLPATHIGLSAMGNTTDWYLDSGATQHMTGGHHHLTSAKPFASTIQGINSTAPVTH